MTLIAILIATLAAGIGSVWAAALLVRLGLGGRHDGVGPQHLLSLAAGALLATALGLVAAIPAVVIYNVFARSITGYKAQVADASAQVLLLVSRNLDLPGSERVATAKTPPHMVKVG